MTSHSERTFLDKKLSKFALFKNIFKKSNIFGISLHKGTDIEYALSFMNGKNNIVAFDLQSSLMEILAKNSKAELETALIENPRSYDVMLKSYLKQYIRSLKKIYEKSSKIIFIDSDPNLLRFIGIKKKNLLRLIPAQPILKEIFDNEKNDKEQIEEFRKSRERVLSQTEYAKLDYTSSTEMLSKIATFLRLEAN